MRPRRERPVEGAHVGLFSLFGAGNIRNETLRDPGRCPMSTPSASVCERDFRSQEALRYSRPYHRMRKVPGRVTSSRGVGVPACRRRMRNGHAFLRSSTRTPLLTVSICRVSNGRPSSSRVPPASPSQRVHAYGNIRHSAEFSRTLAEHFAVESRLPTAHNASCGALRTGQRLPMREGCRARPPPGPGSERRSRRGAATVPSPSTSSSTCGRPADSADAPFSERPRTN